AFRLNINHTYGSVVEIVSSNNIKSDIESQHLQPVNDSNLQPPRNTEHISDQCKHSSYAYWLWENLTVQQQDASKYYVTFYEDYQSLSAKLDYIKNNNLAGIAIADITKDSQQILFWEISREKCSSGSVVGSFIFVSILVATGFILYSKHKAKMSNPLIDTNNQACSDTNPQVYSDINRQ
ncbi:28818_t:CDS:2, partial [Racocetra persica]